MRGDGRSCHAAAGCKHLRGRLQEHKGGVTGKPAVVAPIFVHGEGRGETGCVVVNPPMFLSEQDAMQVIKEQMGKAGIALSSAHVPFQGVTLPQAQQWWQQQWWLPFPKPGGTPDVEAKVLILAGLDPKKGVGVEYVSSENYYNLGGAQPTSTVQDYDFKEVAADVGKYASRGHDIFFGTFYDPVSPSWGDLETQRRLSAMQIERSKLKDPQLVAQKDKEIRRTYDELLALARARSRKLLEEQVKDFIDWLKGQGVI